MNYTHFTVKREDHHIYRKVADNQEDEYLTTITFDHCACGKIHHLHMDFDLDDKEDFNLKENARHLLFGVQLSRPNIRVEHKETIIKPQA